MHFWWVLCSILGAVILYYYSSFNSWEMLIKVCSVILLLMVVVSLLMNQIHEPQCCVMHSKKHEKSYLHIHLWEHLTSNISAVWIQPMRPIWTSFKCGATKWHFTSLQHIHFKCRLPFFWLEMQSRPLQLSWYLFWASSFTLSTSWLLSERCSYCIVFIILTCCPPSVEATCNKLVVFPIYISNLNSVCRYYFSRAFKFVIRSSSSSEGVYSVLMEISSEIVRRKRGRIVLLSCFLSC